ncbi:hypothetical protein ABZ192_27935 [Streptomyces sp. NPDC006235]|uniref:hypothetical protein n=1 Tax=Streptomyces sp. NPDC006235 TaxID=3156736 RepID=UPI0033B0B4F9
MSGSRTGILRGAALETRTRWHLWAVLVLIFVSVWNAFGNLTPGVGFWPNAVHSVVLSGVLSSCGMAGLAALAGGREQQRGLSYLTGMSSVPAWWLPGAQLLAMVAWASLAYGFVAVAVVVRVLLEAPAGEIGISGWLAGWCAVVAWTVLGYSVGRLWPSRFTAPLAAVAPFAVYVVHYDLVGHTGYLLFPFLDELVTPYDLPHDGLYAGQAVWLAGVAVAGAGVCLARLLSRRAIIGVAVASLALVVTGVAVLSPLHGRFHQPALSTAESARLSTVCTTSRGLAICVHPAFESALPELRDTFTDTAARLAHTPQRMTRLVQQERSSTPAPGTAPLYLDDLRPGRVEEAREDLISSLTDFKACNLTQDNPRIAALTELVQQWLAHGRADASAVPGLPAPTTELRTAQQTINKWSSGQGSTWLSDHWGAFRTCTLSGQDFR